ncbi:MAG: Gfo/Idh/MocA family oxidoreductase [Actinobacteria bacterium]|nr:MAG: Gfo/Idh/MocA family oxidoreductase [Actinomycetota bacterium]
MSAPLRLGIIGANPHRGWASRAHLPAVAASDDVELAAVATTRIDSAAEAAEQFGARNAYADPLELIADPQVEAVTVAVKVPEHFALVRAALEAGKHVYSEWPLGVNTDEAVALRDLAAQRRLHTVVGLQNARSTQIQRARELLAEGRIGRVLSATLRSASGMGGPTVAAAQAWLADAVNGTNLLTVTAGHALDTLAAVIGEFESLSATVATQFPEAVVADTGKTIPVTSPDQIAIAGLAGDGAVVTAHVQGASAARPGLVIEVRGTDGLLEITAAPSLAAAAIALRIVTDGDDAEDVSGRPDDSVARVGRVYADLAAAVRTDSPQGSNFDHAVRRHRLLDAIEQSSAERRRVEVPA